MNTEKGKKIIIKCFFLPPVLTLLIAAPSYGLVIYALAGGNAHPAAIYASYLLSAYALIITVTGVARIVSWIRREMGQHPVIKGLPGLPLFNRLLKEDIFRAEAGIYQGFVINLIYAGIKLVSGIRYRSLWFVTLAVYYILLAAMRFSLLDQVRKKGTNGRKRNSDWRRYRLCGIILLFMDQALMGIILLVLHRNSSFEYPGMLIYIMALYTFYAIITAVRNVIRFRRYGNPVLSAAKVINLTAALVSVLSLETAMLTQFGAADDAGFRRLMTASTGAGVSILVLGMAIYMIVYATGQLKSCHFPAANNVEAKQYTDDIVSN